MAAVRPDDDDDTFRAKTRLVASFLDLFVARRMVNFRNFGYSTIKHTMFNLARDVRNKDLDQLRDVLSDRVADINESFDGVRNFRLTQRNRSHIRYLLARMTAWIEKACGTGIGFAKYVDWKRKYRFEVEHIWADKYERDGREFNNPHDFAYERDRFGDLLLLPRDFNASFGDARYTEKLPHYFGQNLLAASLSPLAYVKNPSFVRFINETRLPFRGHPEAFKKSDIKERQELYRKICEQVWSPERLGLGGGTPSNTATKKARKAFYGIGLSHLFEARLLKSGEILRGARSGVEYRATVLPDGKIRVESGKAFDTLSGAADNLTGKSCNGWTFWHVSRSEGLIELARIREEYLALDTVEHWQGPVSTDGP